MRLLRKEAPHTQKHLPLLPWHFLQPCSPSPPFGAASFEASAARRCPSGGGSSESASPHSCQHSAPGQTTAIRGDERIATVCAHNTLYGQKYLDSSIHIWSGFFYGLEWTRLLDFNQ